MRFLTTRRLDLPLCAYIDGQMPPLASSWALLCNSWWNGCGWSNPSSANSGSISRASWPQHRRWGSNHDSCLHEATDFQISLNSKKALDASYSLKAGQDAKRIGLGVTKTRHRLSKCSPREAKSELHQLAIKPKEKHAHTRSLSKSFAKQIEEALQ